jgi:TRAP-type C4-dicarboxylate transport system substrate-binding protein
MTISRRSVLTSALAAPAIAASTRLGSAAPAQTLKISHQFPGGTIDEGDFRDRLCRKFAAELEKRTDGAIAAQVYPIDVKDRDDDQVGEDEGDHAAEADTTIPEDRGKRNVTD